MDLKIDPEFEQKIPPLTDEEFALLEENIMSDGEIRDPLVIWNGIILDGHNRFRIWQKHPEIPYRTHEINLPDRLAAIIWICKNQLGRRNLTPEQRKYLIGKQYETLLADQESVRQERDRNGRFYRGSQNRYDGEEKTQRIRDKLARENSTTGSYVQRASHYAKGVDAADEVLPGIREEILSGYIRPTAKAVTDVVKADKAERRKLAERLRQPRARPKLKQDTAERYRDDEEDEEDAGKKNGRLPYTVPTKEEILAVSEGMLHSKGIAAAKGEDIIYEMRSALEDMIWRWNNVGELYAGLLKEKEVQKSARGLATKGITFLREIKKGVLWNEKG